MKFLSRFEKSDKPILTRYYLYRSKWLGIKLHHIKQSDPEFHTHPLWGLSLILGYYHEEYEEEWRSRISMTGIQPPYPQRLRLFFNIVSPWRRHRVKTRKPVWTLFIHGPRVNENWSYGNKAAQWRGPDKKAA